MKANQAAANKIELESQILSAALRQSMMGDDIKGIKNASHELCEIFPDLLPALKLDDLSTQNDYYSLLDLQYSDSSTLTVAQFLKVVRYYLKNLDINSNVENYISVLNAGFVLRKPRLRLSHDLVCARAFISGFKTTKTKEEPKLEPQPILQQPTVEQPKESLPQEESVNKQEQIQSNQAILESEAQINQELEAIKETQQEISDQSFDNKATSSSEAQVYIEREKTEQPKIEQPKFEQPKVEQPKAEQAKVEQPKVEQPKVEQPKAKASDESENKLPMLIQLMQYSQIISDIEVKALINQMRFAPEIALKDLILNAGYVTQNELNSLILAETLIIQGRISMAQFAVAMYDERNNNVRMAESLQNRGWLETNANK